VREPLAPAWRDLLVSLRRMESRGEVRGGRFVAAFLGEQFALPEALDLLRAIRRTGETATHSDFFGAPVTEPSTAEYSGASPTP
jgi:ATP-dependent helicase Lhr and Lhr-like helicase